MDSYDSRMIVTNSVKHLFEGGEGKCVNTVSLISNVLRQDGVEPRQARSQVPVPPSPDSTQWCRDKRVDTVALVTWCLSVPVAIATTPSTMVLKQDSVDCQ